MVSLEPVLEAEAQEAIVERAVWHKGQRDEDLLRSLLEQHHRWTGSLRARELLDKWSEAREMFVKVFPNEYRRALAELSAAAVERKQVASA